VVKWCGATWGGMVAEGCYGSDGAHSLLTVILAILIFSNLLKAWRTPPSLHSRLAAFSLLVSADGGTALGYTEVVPSSR